MYAARHAYPTRVYADTEYDRTYREHEAREVADLLASLHMDTEELGDGGQSDYTLSILCALAGVGDPDATDYIAPILERAARLRLSEVGFLTPDYPLTGAPVATDAAAGLSV